MNYLGRRFFNPSASPSWTIARKLIRQRIPDISQVHHEVCKRTFALDFIHACARFHCAIRPVDGDRAVAWINQPTQLCSLRKVLGHLQLKRLQPVTFGADLNDEIRAKMPERILFGGTELLDTGFQSPGGIRRATGAIGQDKPGGGVADNTFTVLSGPNSEFRSNLRIASTCIGICRCHNDQFPFGGHFKIEVRMLRAKNTKRRICHRRNRQDRWQKYVVNGERHNASLPRQVLKLGGLLAGLPVGMVSLGANIRLVSDGIVETENAEHELFGFDRTRQISMKCPEAVKAWGQTDDITVVTVQRFK